MSIDTIGPLFDEGGEAVPGWHVNVTPDEVTPALTPFVVTPALCRRVWAGDDPAAPVMTVCLRFADQAEAEAVLGVPEGMGE